MPAKSAWSGVMPKAMPSMPRAPAPHMGRYASSGNEGRPRATRIWSAAPPRSGALSIRVPSRSNSTARTPRNTSGLPGRDEVVHRRVAAEPVALAERVVAEAARGLRLEPAGAAVAGEFGRADELQ